MNIVQARARALGVVAGVLAQDDEALEDGCDREVLLCGQLRSLTVSQQHRRGVSLEACDGFGFAGLTHHIYSLQTAQRLRHITCSAASGGNASHVRNDITVFTHYCLIY